MFPRVRCALGMQLAAFVVLASLGEILVRWICNPPRLLYKLRQAKCLCVEYLICCVCSTRANYVCVGYIIRRVCPAGFVRRTMRWMRLLWRL